MLGQKKFRMVTNFFKNKKIKKFLKFIYNNDFFFFSQISVVLWQPESQTHNVELLLRQPNNQECSENTV